MIKMVKSKNKKKEKSVRKVIILLNGLIMFSGIFFLTSNPILAAINLCTPVVIMYLLLEQWGLL